MEKSVVYHLPLFESSQILSHVHLNDLRDYLDRESRDTRTQLIGAGIVCGLRVKVVPGEDSITIQVTAGHGVTTDGYILGLKRNYAFTRYKPYTDLADPKYFFGKVTSETKPVLFELYEDDENVENAPLVDFDDRETPEFKNMALVLYLEETKTDLKSCTGTNCDNKGKRDDRLIRALLLDKTYLNTYNNELLARRTDVFARLNVPRVLLHTMAGIDTDLKLRNAYQDVIFSMRTTISNTVNNTLSLLNIPLSLNKNAWDVVRTKVDTFGNGHKYYQYSYDALCDIMHTYNDFIDAAEEFAGGCKKLVFPNLFPLHLVLAELTYADNSLHDEYRTTFFNIQPVDEQDEKLVTVQLLYEKIIQLINRYQPPAAKPVSITPSRYFYAPYTAWAIPSYYNLATTGLRLAEIWSPKLYLDGRGPEHFYYDPFVLNNAPPDHIANPFRYDKKPYPYYRVENLGGKKIEDAVLAVEQLRKAYGLNFDIKVATLETVQAKGLPCGVEDLQEDYFFTRNKLINVFESVSEYIKLLLSYPEVQDMLKNEIEKDFSIDDILNAWTRLEKDVINALPLCLSDFNYIYFRDIYKKYANIIIEAIMRIGFSDPNTTIIKGGMLGSDSGDKEIIDPPKEPVGDFESTAISLAISLATRTLFGLLRSFYFTQVYRIYYAYEIRLKKAQSRPHTLRDYITRFPGLEHIAGTLENGTLLLVCTEVTAPAIGTSIMEELSEVVSFRKPGIFGEISKNEFADLLIKDISYDIGKVPDSANTYIIRPNLTKEDILRLQKEEPDSPIVKRITDLEKEVSGTNTEYAVNFYIKGDSVVTESPIEITPAIADKIIDTENIITQPIVKLGTENPLLDVEDGLNVKNTTIGGTSSGPRLIFRSPTPTPTMSSGPSLTTEMFKQTLLNKLGPNNTDFKQASTLSADILFNNGIITDGEIDKVTEQVFEMLNSKNWNQDPTTNDIAEATAGYLEELNLLTAGSNEQPIDPPQEDKNEWMEKLGQLFKEIIIAINKAPDSPPPGNVIPPKVVDRFVVADFFIGADTCPCECDDACPDKAELATLPIPPLAQTDFVIVKMNKAVEIFPEMNDVGIFGDFLEVAELVEDKPVVTEKGVVLGKSKHNERMAFVYAAPPDYTGIDRFQYTVRNKINKLSDTAFVWIVVNDTRKTPYLSMTDTMLCFQDGPQLVTIVAEGWEPGTLEVTGIGITKGKDNEWLFDPTDPAVVPGINKIHLVEIATKKVWQTLDVSVIRIEPSISLDSFNWSDIMIGNISQKRLTANFSSVAAGADNFLWTITYLGSPRSFNTSNASITIDVSPEVQHVDLDVTFYASNSASGCGRMISKVYGFDNSRENPVISVEGPKDFCHNDPEFYPIQIVLNDWTLNEIDIIGSGVIFQFNEISGKKEYFFKPSQSIVTSGMTRIELINAANGAVLQTINLPVQQIATGFVLANYNWFLSGSTELISFFISNTTPPMQADTFEWFINDKPFITEGRDFSQTISPNELDRDFGLPVKLIASMFGQPCKFEFTTIVYMPPNFPPREPEFPIFTPGPIFTETIIQPINPIEPINPILPIQPINPLIQPELTTIQPTTTVVQPTTTTFIQPELTTIQPTTTTFIQPELTIQPTTTFVQPVTTVTQPTTTITQPTTTVIQPTTTITQPTTTVVQPTETTVVTQPISPVSTVSTTPTTPTFIAVPQAQPDAEFLKSAFQLYVDAYAQSAASSEIAEAFSANTTLTSRIASLRTTVVKMAALATPLASVTETSVSTSGSMLKTLIAAITPLPVLQREMAIKLTHEALMLFWLLVAHRKTDITSNTTFVGYANYMETTLMPFLEKNGSGITKTDRRVYTELALMADKPSLQSRFSTLAGS